MSYLVVKYEYMIEASKYSLNTAHEFKTLKIVISGESTPPPFLLYWGREQNQKVWPTVNVNK